jgi:hypothetical protein
MRVIVLGGAGNFGARIVRALRGDRTIDLLVAGRRLIAVPGAEDVPCAVVDIGAPDFAQQLRALSPELVIHCVGPFQGQGYGVAKAALAAGAHYLDLADGRQFIAEFAVGVNDQAIRVGRVAISGASTLPALSSAVVAAACDVPDLELFPARYAGIQTVSFHAALEFGAQHLALWGLAALRRIGLPFPVARWAVSLNRLAGMFDAGAGEKGGMRVSIVGDRSGGGGRVRRTWQLIAPAVDGPEIPCMAANILARRLARGEVFKSGAFPCMGFLALSEFAPEFARWKITTRVEEVAA